MENNNQSTKLTTDDLTAKATAFKPAQNLNSNTKTGETPMKNEAQKMEMIEDSSHDRIIRYTLNKCLLKLAVIENHLKTMGRNSSEKDRDLAQGFEIICKEVFEELETVHTAHGIPCIMAD